MRTVGRPPLRRRFTRVWEQVERTPRLTALYRRLLLVQLRAPTLLTTVRTLARNAVMSRDDSREPSRTVRTSRVSLWR